MENRSELVEIPKRIRISSIRRAATLKCCPELPDKLIQFVFCSPSQTTRDHCYLEIERTRYFTVLLPSHKKRAEDTTTHEGSIKGSQTTLDLANCAKAAAENRLEAFDVRECVRESRCRLAYCCASASSPCLAWPYVRGQNSTYFCLRARHTSKVLVMLMWG